MLRVEMVGGLMTGFIQPQSACLFQLICFYWLKVFFGKPPRINSSQFMGQARALGPETWVKQRLWAISPGQAKALEPWASVKQRLWSHWPGPSESWRQVEGPKGWDRTQDSNVQLLTNNLHTRVSLCFSETLHKKFVSRNFMARVLSELPSEFLVQPSMWPL